MGADRRGPLAAFVVVAIIAAILLVTSVRSQAAPSLMAGPPPERVVVVPPPATARLWSSVSHHAGQVVQDGVVLAHKATETTSEDTATVTSTSTAPTTSAEPATAGSAPPAPVPASESAGHHARPHHQRVTQLSEDAVPADSHTAGNTPSGADRSRQAEHALGQQGGAPTRAATDRDHVHHLGWTYHFPALGFGHAWH